ncbi:hypothetical protein KNP414_05312 [Paenibacillus mucilaginosus KNP414]|uniref:Uncharacterized protein n=1 Tax=Paenibacillus mucilaginosus (strain KNP414) TaxID=1036673 RepID=F8FE77_PAEMK|nr:hypothetical protein KNP414_05312 [Paenibacillus mucilaginosus KNP414]
MAMPSYHPTQPPLLYIVRPTSHVLPLCFPEKIAGFARGTFVG